MGVSFMVCGAAECNVTFPDAGEYGECWEDFSGCGAVFCSDEHAQLKRVDEPNQPIPTWDEREAMTDEQREKLEISCVECRMQNPTDTNLLEFLMHRLAITREELTKRFLSPETVAAPPFENINRWLLVHGKNIADKHWRFTRDELDDLEGRILVTLRQFRRDHGTGFSKTESMILEDVKDPDGWTMLATSLGVDEVTQRRHFKFGEFANVEIIVNENLQIVGGRIIPRHG